MVAGGLGPMFTFRGYPELEEMIRSFYESEKPTAVCCHGTAALVDLKLSDGSYLVHGGTPRYVPARPSSVVALLTGVCRLVEGKHDLAVRTATSMGPSAEPLAG